MPRFPKPRFSELVTSYRKESNSVHECKLIDPTTDGINTCAARMSEALVLANHLAADRAAIAHLGNGRGSGRTYLLGKLGYSDFGKLCPHGIGRGAQDLGAFLAHHWGPRTLGWKAQTEAPDEIKNKTGILLFARLPDFDGQGHIDLWNKTAAVGHAYWSAQTIWFWQLA
jgi:hypothetical protein